MKKIYCSNCENQIKDINTKTNTKNLTLDLELNNDEISQKAESLKFRIQMSKKFNIFVLNTSKKIIDLTSVAASKFISKQLSTEKEILRAVNEIKESIKIIFDETSIYINQISKELLEGFSTMPSKKLIVMKN